ERVALEFEILVARCAGRGYHGGSYAFVLAMAEHAGFCAEFGASLGKSWLKESMHGVGILIPRVTTGALFVSNGGVAECGVGGTQSEPLWLGVAGGIVPGASLWQSLQTSASCPVLGGPLAWKRAACGIATMAVMVAATTTPPTT